MPSLGVELQALRAELKRVELRRAGILSEIVELEDEATKLQALTPADPARGVLCLPDDLMHYLFVRFLANQYQLAAVCRRWWLYLRNPTVDTARYLSRWSLRRYRPVVWKFGRLVNATMSSQMYSQQDDGVCITPLKIVGSKCTYKGTRTRRIKVGELTHCITLSHSSILSSVPVWTGDYKHTIHDVVVCDKTGRLFAVHESCRGYTEINPETGKSICHQKGTYTGMAVHDGEIYTRYFPDADVPMAVLRERGEFRYKMVYKMPIEDVHFRISRVLVNDHHVFGVGRTGFCVWDKAKPDRPIGIERNIGAIANACLHHNKLMLFLTPLNYPRDRLNSNLIIVY